MGKSSSKKNNCYTVANVPPPIIPAMHRNMINPSMLNEIAKVIKLKVPQSFRQHSVLREKTSKFITPLHFYAAHESWADTLHCIRYFHQLHLAQQEAEVAKAKSFTREQKRYLWKNRDRLIENRPTSLVSTRPPSKGMSDRQYENQLSHLTSLSAERASSTKAKLIAANILGDVQNTPPPSRPTSYATTNDTTTMAGPSLAFSTIHDPNNKPDEGITCVECGFESTSEMLERTGKYHAGHLEPSQCAQCVEAMVQASKLNAKNELLARMYNQQLELEPNNNNSESNLCIDVSGFLVTQLGIHHASSIIKLFPKTQIQAKVIQLGNHIENDKQFKSISKHIDGATWEEDKEGIHPNIIEHDNQHDLTIIKLPLRPGQKLSQQNFAIIMDSQIEQESLETFTRIEMNTSISKFEKGSRPGAASGVYLLGETCKSFTKVTKNATTLYVASSPKAVNMKAYYYNYQGVIKMTNFGYKMLFMKRLHTRQKLIDAYRYLSYKAILKREAMCYLIAIAAWTAAHKPLSQQDEINLNNLHDILSKQNGQCAEDCLVDWMCTTGEMRNHQALCCHSDKNKNNPMEVYTLFSRYGIEKKDGFLYLPLDNVVLKLFRDEQIMICNISNTPHVPDSRRNTNNFSKVHGPCP